MYADVGEVTQENFRELLLAAYRLAMDHYPEGSATCKRLFQTLQAVIDSAVSIREPDQYIFIVTWYCQK